MHGKPLSVDKGFEPFRAGLAGYLGLTTYREIIEYQGNVAADENGFQRTFNAYYKVRRNQLWRKRYYSLFQEAREGLLGTVDFATLLHEISRFPNNTVEASFTSKMLASIDVGKPIWDSRVIAALKLLGYPTPTELVGGKDARIKQAIEGYDVLVSSCTSLLDSTEGKGFVAAFNRLFPMHIDISDMKKLDFALWCTGGKLVDKARKKGFGS